MVLSLIPLTLQLCLVLGYQALDLRLHALGKQKMTFIAKPASPYPERQGLGNRDSSLDCGDDAGDDDKVITATTVITTMIIVMMIVNTKSIA